MKLCKPASGGRGEATAAYAFGVPRKCSKIAPGGNIFFHKRPKKKQLYRQEVPERRSEQQKHQHKFFFLGGGFPRLYVWKKHGSTTQTQRSVST